ncbi:MAG: hypothetical protein GY832_38620 [Chloroflexi bacterium]|nr:hypothetical protein [Chloroflexota bacterium]
MFCPQIAAKSIGPAYPITTATDAPPVRSLAVSPWSAQVVCWLVSPWAGGDVCDHKRGGSRC